jgi:hypothetical protein
MQLAVFKTEHLHAWPRSIVSAIRLGFASFPGPRAASARSQVCWSRPFGIAGNRFPSRNIIGRAAPKITPGLEADVSQPLKSIVAAHVKLKNRKALEGLLAHRRGMLGRLQAVTGINASSAIQTVQDEIAIIDAALDELQPPSGSLRENEWT